MVLRAIKSQYVQLHNIEARFLSVAVENCSDKAKILENGVFAVNKTKNTASTETVEIIKNVLSQGILHNNLKVGHGGVLDKTATGVLVLGICNGCKILPKFLYGVKKYKVKGQLGISTTTYNETGEIVDQMPYDHVTKETLVKSLEKFIGKIKQTPPVYSALKLQGRRYADLAREGKEVSPKPRLVNCYSLECTHFELPYFSLSLKCGSGFYVRSLVHDLGKVGSCAHVVELHRTQHGVFKEHEALDKENWTLEDILKSIQSAKGKYKHLFKEVDKNMSVKNNRGNSDEGAKEKTLPFDDTLFDL